MYSPPSLIATGIILPILGLIAVSIRFYVRIKPKKNLLGIDDWMILVASMLVCAMGALQIIGAVMGEYGRQGQVEDPDRMRITLQVNYILVVVEKPLFGLVKLSVLLFYRRIFTFRWFTLLNNILITITVLWTITFLFADAFLCGVYPQAQWDKAYASKHCANVLWILLWFAITDVIGDLLILSLPYPCIRKLQMDTRKKIAISGVFLLGAFAVIAGIVRLGFVAQNFAPKTVKTKNDSGETIVTLTPGPTLWTLVEVSVGVIAACLPILAPLLKKLPGAPSRTASYFKHMTSNQSSRKQSTKLRPEMEPANSTKGSSEVGLTGKGEAGMGMAPVWTGTGGPSKRAEGKDDLEMGRLGGEVEKDSRGFGGFMHLEGQGW